MNTLKSISETRTALKATGNEFCQKVCELMRDTSIAEIQQNYNHLKEVWMMNTMFNGDTAESAKEWFEAHLKIQQKLYGGNVSSEQLMMEYTVAQLLGPNVGKAAENLIGLVKK